MVEMTTEYWDFRTILGVDPATERTCVAHKVPYYRERCGIGRFYIGKRNLLEAGMMLDTMDREKSISKCQGDLDKLARLMVCGNPHRKHGGALENLVWRWNSKIEAYVASLEQDDEVLSATISVATASSRTMIFRGSSDILINPVAATSLQSQQTFVPHSFGSGPIFATKSLQTESIGLFNNTVTSPSNTELEAQTIIHQDAIKEKNIVQDESLPGSKGRFEFGASIHHNMQSCKFEFRQSSQAVSDDEESSAIEHSVVSEETLLASNEKFEFGTESRYNKEPWIFGFQQSSQDSKDVRKVEEVIDQTSKIITTPNTPPSEEVKTEKGEPLLASNGTFEFGSASQHNNKPWIFEFGQNSQESQEHKEVPKHESKNGTTPNFPLYQRTHSLERLKIEEGDPEATLVFEDEVSPLETNSEPEDLVEIRKFEIQLLEQQQSRPETSINHVEPEVIFSHLELVSNINVELSSISNKEIIQEEAGEHALTSSELTFPETSDEQKSTHDSQDINIPEINSPEINILEINIPEINILEINSPETDTLDITTFSSTQIVRTPDTNHIPITIKKRQTRSITNAATEKPPPTPISEEQQHLHPIPTIPDAFGHATIHSTERRSSQRFSERHAATTAKSLTAEEYGIDFSRQEQKPTITHGTSTVVPIGKTSKSKDTAKKDGKTGRMEDKVNVKKEEIMGAVREEIAWENDRGSIVRKPRGVRKSLEGFMQKVVTRGRRGLRSSDD